MRFSDKVKALGLPLEQIVVIGSGLLDQLGLREARDIDLVVTTEVLDYADKSGEYQCGVEHGDRFCRNADVELWENWREDMPYELLAASAIDIDGVRYVAPDVLLAKKRARGSQKDLEDIAALESYYATA